MRRDSSARRDSAWTTVRTELHFCAQSLLRSRIPKHHPDLKIALTDFKVTIPGKARSVKVKGKTQKMSYLQLTSCKGSLPAKALANFSDADTGASKAIGSPQANAKC